MADVNPSESFHKQLLEWAHEQVRIASERTTGNGGTRDEDWSIAKSKLGFIGAVLIGAATAGWESVIGLGRTLQSAVFESGSEEAEDAWERATLATRSFFDGLTGLVDSRSILTGQDIKHISAINAYGKQLTEMNDISPDVRKTLLNHLKNAQVMVKTGSQGAGQEVSQLFKLLDTVKESPVGASEKLKNMKWTRQQK